MADENGTWLWSLEHESPCRLVDQQAIWNHDALQVWVPGKRHVQTVTAHSVLPIDNAPIASHNRVNFAAAAARIIDALQQDTLAAPFETNLIPLPHQILALSRALSGDRVRFLLADEVGLGKTIEAGLVLRELKIRGLVERTLVVAPAGLTHQWVQEMKARFNEVFRLVQPSDFDAFRSFAGIEAEDNLWRFHDQVVCPVDSVKPVDKRRGWSHEQLARYNRERFEDLVSAGWDLIIIDEAHRLAGTSELVARYRLGEGLSQASPYLLLLTATPHQGKTDAFRRLVSFLDREAFPDDSSVTRDRVGPYVIRTEKKHAIDPDGKSLFMQRLVELKPVAWGTEHEEQRALYVAVTDYVREGYNQAIRTKQNAIGFLMILMQRMVSSSTRAIRRALERRLDVLELPEGQLSLFPEDIVDDWQAMDPQEQMDEVLKARLKGLQNERAEVELMLSAARRCEAKSPDVKAECLLEEIRRLQRIEGDPEVKVLVFTEFVPTQEMLAEFLGERGFSVTRLNGSMGMEERLQAQRDFAGAAQIMVSTEAGGEGLNLQFCHVVVNYDLPWNPMRVEQRIGRVDRIGQTSPVKVLNLTLDGTVESRVREVLEQKLARILQEFGVDKLSDVLDSEQGDVDFEEIYRRALLDPESALRELDDFAEGLRDRALEARDGLRSLAESQPIDPAEAKRISDHQLPHWTERMTVSYLRDRRDAGGMAEHRGGSWNLRWPGDEQLSMFAFHRGESDLNDVPLLTVEDSRVRKILRQLPTCAPGQPIPSFRLKNLPGRISGFWSLWRIAIQAPTATSERMLPIFVSDDGGVLLPAARMVWDRLVTFEPEHAQANQQPVTGSNAERAFVASRAAAENKGQTVFEQLVSEHRSRLQREAKKMQFSFAARRRNIERIGLHEVRQFRLRQLENDQTEWGHTLEVSAQILPSLHPVILVRITAGE